MGLSLTASTCAHWPARFSQIGASECDELVNLLPEHLHADANVFIARLLQCAR